MVKCCKCGQNILLVGCEIPMHGETKCPDCETELYYVSDRTYPLDWVTVGHETKSVRIDTPENVQLRNDW